MNKELAFTSAWEMRDLIANKKISPLEITQIYFDRIHKLDSHLNSYLILNEEEALKTFADKRKAEEIEKELHQFIL